MPASRAWRTRASAAEDVTQLKIATNSVWRERRGLPKYAALDNCSTRNAEDRFEALF